MTAPFITNAVAIVGLDAITALFDTGTAAVIEGYDGAIPADADAAEANVLLFTCTMSAIAFGGAVDANPNARATAAAITPDASADNTGTLTHFRVKTQTGGTVVFQGTAGTSGTDMVISTTAITAGAVISISSFTLTLPEG